MDTDMETMLFAVTLICDTLDDGELAGMFLCASAEWDPRQYPWYEKAKILFTQDSGLKMHEETKKVVARALLRRL